MAVRPYEPRDFYDVAEINRLCYLWPCSHDELRAKLENPSWVSGNPVQGALITSSENDKIWIWSVTVSPDARRQGNASLLLSECEKHFKGQTLWLHTEPDGLAFNLYLKRGYIARKFLKDFYGPNIPAVEMNKFCG